MNFVVIGAGVLAVAAIVQAVRIGVIHRDWSGMIPIAAIGLFAVMVLIFADLGTGR